MPLLSLNGAIIDAAQARIPLDDRGFRFGDGVFETISLHGGVPYQWELHMHRLSGGLQALRIRAPEADLKAELRALLAASSHPPQGRIRISITRGSGSMGYRPKPGIAPLRLIELLPVRAFSGQSIALFHSRWRKPSLDTLPVHFKLMQGVNATLSLLEAEDNGCTQALQSDGQEHLSEASSGNLFWAHDGALFTPAPQTGCLMGTTRSALLRLWPSDVHEVRELPGVLQHADGVFITNAAMGAVAVSELRPQGWKWPQSESLCATAAALLAQDKDAYAQEHSDDWR